MTVGELKKELEGYNDRDIIRVVINGDDSSINMYYCLNNIFKGKIVIPVIT